MVEILQTIDKCFDGLLGKIPCYNTIENWVKKCGLKSYQSSTKKLQSIDYAEIIDESMMIGSEKLLLTLGVPAKHQGRPLKFSDVSILDMSVSESWNGEKITEKLNGVSKNVGKAPLYVISDNASNIAKGIRCSGFNHQRDISHSLGMFLERTYKNEQDFKTYLKKMTEPKFKHNMKKIAYLLPPKQRTIARFMNLTDWVEWSSKILENFHTLQEEERLVFSFVPQNASLINELSEVISCINKIENLCKNKGLSQQTVNQCKQEVNQHLLKGTERMIQLGLPIYRFLSEELKIITTKIIHNNSSDIIESIFGKYKARKSFNKLNGVTPYILFIPLHVTLIQPRKY